MPKAKLAAAVLCVLVAVTGMVQDIPWITISALVLWGLSVAYFGKGDRSKFKIDEDEIRSINNENKHE